MACAEAESLQKLSLLDVSEPSLVQPLLQQSPLRESSLAAKIDNIHTDFVIIEFVWVFYLFI